MNAAQLAAFQANSGITPGEVSAVLIGAVFAVLLLWGAWAARTAYVGWAEEQLSQRQLLIVVARVVVLYLVLTLALLS
ncbi:TIGR03758 family integrating conjugative element protein [Pseudomonas putida]|jgi:integrating conjugative element protein (TIGR03758 family)|uniref:TIGR03758 family integrating conjugative element protein n=1 Tax=Pseudomonas putida TaxID=303 RepID=UPI000C2AF31B|nr:TIGR03758 family integrating conjugative element protein [Pseudomonas putida]MBF8160941.1 TIGR03758 family integrating conjugative element protein [Pseudomonas mendocina]PJX08591.1 TIGR03758 family integrating conjugative element protein [Pseudomonas putida]HCF5435880.1 TIGR03758 family integrating conjugative element protein [Pseudomonas aeruginosa]